MEDLYNRILQMGIDRGYKNMTAICTAADVHRSIMTEYKKGRTLGLSLDTISKFSSLYDVPVDEILNGTIQGNLDHELRGYRMWREAEKETPAAPKNDGVKGLSDFEKSVIEFLRSDRDFYAQTELGIEMAKRKIEIFFRI